MKERVQLGAVQETLLIPLWARAVDFLKPHSILKDAQAAELVKRIDYDFSKFAGAWKSQVGCCLRGAIFDQWTQAELAQDPETLVVEIGAGLDTRYERLGGAARRWIDLDLPDTMALRRRFFAENSQRRFVEGSVLAADWVNPVREMTALAKANRQETIVLIDGAQAVSHMNVDVQELGCDLYAFSGHKLYAPTGIGALWGKRELLEKLPPWMGGGEMIKEVTFEKTVYNDIPFKYEAGTPNIGGAVGLAAAIRYVSGLGLDNIAAHEQKLTDMAVEGLKAMPRLTVLAPDVPHSAVVSVLAEGVHHYDLGTLLDQMGIAVRTGHHCCQPLMCALGTTGTTRASFALYNTEEEVQTFLKSMNRALDMLS